MTPRDAAVDAAYEDVAKLLANGKRFLLTGHRNPDGDALGSALGLALALEAAGKEARVVMRDAWSSAYAKMPGISRVLVADALPADWPAGWDALFTMECPEADRAGWPNLLAGRGRERRSPSRQHALRRAQPRGPPGRGRGRDRGRPPRPPRMAALAGTSRRISGCRSSPTRARSATRTRRRRRSRSGRGSWPKGAEPGPVNEFLFEAAPLSTLKLEALVLGTLELHAGGTVATVELPRRFFAESGAKDSDTEGLVNRARGIEGVRAAAAPSGRRERRDPLLAAQQGRRGHPERRRAPRRRRAPQRLGLPRGGHARLGEGDAGSRGRRRRGSRRRVGSRAGARVTGTRRAPRAPPASSSSTSPRSSRPTTSWTWRAGCSGRAASATRGRSIPPRPGSSSCAWAAPGGCSRSSRAGRRRTRARCASAS